MLWAKVLHTSSSATTTDRVNRQIKVAAAKRGMTVTDYCARPIEERPIRDSERTTKDEAQDKVALLSRMDKLRQEIGPTGISTAEPLAPLNAPILSSSAELHP